MQGFLEGRNSLGVIPRIQIDADYGVLFPLPLKGIDGKIFKKFAPALKNRFEGRTQQGLSKPPWPGQEISPFGAGYQPMDVGGLVHVGVAAPAYLHKILYAYG